MMLIISSHNNLNTVFVLLVLTKVKIKDAACGCSPLLLGCQSRVKGLRAACHAASRTHLP